MASRVIRDAAELAAWVKFLGTQKLPMTVSKVAGANKTNAQNNTIFKWYSEIATQRGDVTVEEQRAECKLHHGVPILRRDNPEWRAEYDETIRPLPYETKLRLIRILEWPVTSKMTSKQAGEYQDTILREFSGMGFTLTIPDDKRKDAA